MNDRDIARLTKALAPFVGVRLTKAPRTHGVTIHAQGAEMHDADIRAVGPEGVTRFWWDGSDEPIPWSAIRRIETFEIGRRWGQPIRRRQRYLRP